MANSLVSTIMVKSGQFDIKDAEARTSIEALETAVAELQSTVDELSAALSENSNGEA